MRANAAGRGLLIPSAGILKPTDRGIALNLPGTSYFEDTDFGGATALPLTLMAWVMPEAAQSSTRIFTVTVGTGLTTLFSMYIAAGSKFQAQHYDGGNKFCTSTTTWATNTWYHVACEFASMSLRKIWVNGVIEASDSGVNSSFVAPNRVSIGRASWGTEYFIGSVIAPVVVRGELTSDLVMRHKANPWQFASIIADRIWGPHTAGAAVPTLSASTYVAGSLTSTGWRPQVTAS
jgi:hypothetical protein